METLTHKGGHAADRGRRHVNFSFRFGGGEPPNAGQVAAKKFTCFGKNTRKHKKTQENTRATIERTKTCKLFRRRPKGYFGARANTKQKVYMT